MKLSFVYVKHHPLKIAIDAFMIVTAVVLVAGCIRIAYIGGWDAREAADAKTHMHESPFVFLEMSKRGDRG